MQVPRGVWDRRQAVNIVNVEATEKSQIVFATIKGSKDAANLMPLREPVFKAQSTSPALLNATETGNSPLLQTGVPSRVSKDGSFSEMLKAEIASEPGLRAINNHYTETTQWILTFAIANIPRGDVPITPWLKSGSAPGTSRPRPPKPPVGKARCVNCVQDLEHRSCRTKVCAPACRPVQMQMI